MKKKSGPKIDLATEHANMLQFLTETFGSHSLTLAFRASKEASDQSKLLNQGSGRSKKKTTTAASAPPSNVPVPVSQLWAESRFVYALINPPRGDLDRFKIKGASITHSIVAKFLGRGETWVSHAQQVFVLSRLHGKGCPREVDGVGRTLEEDGIIGMKALLTFLRGAGTAFDEKYKAVHGDDPPRMRPKPFRIHGGHYSDYDSDDEEIQELYKLDWDTVTDEDRD